MSYYGKFSPIPKYGLPDYQRDSSKWHDFIDEQEHYCLNGYTAGGDTITGRMYFKLNFTTMKVLGEDNYEKESSPYYVDVQREYYDLLDDCIKNGKNILVGKGRDKGFSYDSVSEAIYETHFHDDTSVLALFPGGTSPAKKEWREKFDMTWEGLLPDFKYYPMNGGSKDELYYAWQEKDEETNQSAVHGSKSKLTMLHAVNADVGKSGRYKVMIIEEFGEIKEPLRLIQTSRANMQKGAKKYGIIIAGGTSNAFNEGYKDFRELWYNPAAYNFVKFFIPAQRAYWGFVNYETGKSDEDGALENILENRKSLKGENLMIEMQNYPTKEAEMFIAIKKSPYDTILASTRISEIMSDDTIQKAIQIGNLYPRKNEKGETKVEFHLDPNGRWKIFKTPAKNPLYPDAGGVDVYRFNDVEEPDSKGAIVIYRPYQGINVLGNLPVMIYHHRHPNKESFFEDCLLTAMYYDCKLLIEKSDDHIFDYFKSRGAHKYMKLKPSLIGNTFTGQKADYGVSPSGFATQSAVEISAEDFKKNWQNHVFVELLDELIKFGSENTDLADAFKWAVLHAHSNISILPEYAKEKRKVKFTPYTISDGRGGLIVVNNAEKALNYGGMN